MVGDASGQKDVWSTWSEGYYRSLYKDIKEYPALVLRHKYILDLFDSGGSTILDIGCGPGEMIKDLRSKGCRVVGIDIADGMLKVARENLGSEMNSGLVDLGCGDIENLSFKDETFDGIICAGVIEYLDGDAKALRELNRILRKDGKLILTVRNAACPARMTDLVANRLKAGTAGREMIKAIKNMGSKEKIEMDPYIPYRKHFPWALDKELAAFGFEKEGFRYFHFYPFLAVFDKILPRLFISLGLKMERLSDTRLGLLGSGYIVKARKVKSV